MRPAFVLGFVFAALVAVACSDAPSEPLQKIPPGQFTAISAGGSHACAIDTIGRAWCWGENTYGQVGVDRTNCSLICPTAPILVNTTLRFAAISAGNRHTCGIATDGAAYCWGEGGSGQLGGTTAPPPECFTEPCTWKPTAVASSAAFAQIESGVWSTCGITTTGVGKCWGFTNGLGSTSTPSIPRTVVVPATGDSTWKWIARPRGVSHNCGMTTGGSIACWGSNSYGQLAIGKPDVVNRLPTLVLTGGPALTSVGTAEGFGCGLDATGTAYCWGRSTSGGLAVGADAATDACAVSLTGVSCYGAPRPVIGSVKFSSLTVGASHVCGIVAGAGDTRCWGSNSYFEIGAPAIVRMGSTAPSPIEAAAGFHFTTISAGTNFNCALTADRNVYCWGSNIFGELGNNTNLVFVSGVPIRVRVTTP